MSQDIISDALNQIMNIKKARKDEILIKRHSKFLIKVLEIAKKHGYIESYKIDNTKLTIKIGKLNECKAIKPRFYVGVKNIDKYVRRYLPARDFGFLIISTNKGLMIHNDAMDKNIGGSLIAYFY